MGCIFWVLRYNVAEYFLIIDFMKLFEIEEESIEEAVGTFIEGAVNYCIDVGKLLERIVCWSTQQIRGSLCWVLYVESGKSGRIDAAVVRDRIHGLVRSRSDLVGQGV